MSVDWSLAPTIAFDFSGPRAVGAEVVDRLGTFSIVLWSIGSNGTISAECTGGGSISTTTPVHGVPFTYTPPPEPAGPPLIMVSVSG
jgi:hypothetical protein